MDHEEKPPSPDANPRLEQSLPAREQTMPATSSVKPTETSSVKVESAQSVVATEHVSPLPSMPPTEKEVEIDRLSRFPEIPFDPNRPLGVLLSDEIDYYCKKYQMISPYKPEFKLKPSGYELSVGRFYAMNGKIDELRDGQRLTIPPFSVAVIQTLETLNLPQHLIARWNVRTRWAYKGLLWVGAAQVDAGFRGYLACPLYNLSNAPVEVQYGTEIAVMDFVTTTPPKTGSKRYDWRNRSRVTFKEYEPDKLLSALAELVEEDVAGFKKKLEDMGAKIQGDVSAVQSRVDTFTSSTFGVLAMLFAALGWAVAKNPEPSFWSSTIWLAALSLWFSIRAFVLTKSRLQYWARQTVADWERTRIPWRLEVALGIGLAAVLVFLQYNASKNTGSRLAEMQSQLTTSAQELANSRNQVGELQAVNSKLDQQIKDLRIDVEILKNHR